MTLLEAVNAVRRELREKPVESLDAAYDQFLVGLINRAKRWAEDSWDWKALRTEVTWSTVVNQVEYNLGTSGVGSTATNSRSRILTDSFGRDMVLNLTDDTRLSRIPKEVERSYTLFAQTAAGEPSQFSYKLTGSGIRLSMYPKPDAVYSMVAVCKIPQGDLSTASTSFTIPADAAIYLKAAAWAAAERGGGQGAEAATLDEAARRELDTAIQLEAEATELTAYPV